MIWLEKLLLGRKNLTWFEELLEHWDEDSCDFVFHYVDGLIKCITGFDTEHLINEVLDLRILS